MSGPRHRIHHNARRSCDRQHRYGDHQSQGGYRKIKRDGEKAYDHHMSQKVNVHIKFVVKFSVQLNWCSKI